MYEAIQQTAESILKEIKTRFREGKQLLIAIDGRCAAGKTTLADCLQSLCGCSVIHMDQFFLRPEQQTEERLAEPGGNIDYERFLEEVLIPLQKGVSFSYRPYDCQCRRLAEPVAVTPGGIHIIEGSYACHPALIAYYDFKIFLTVDAKEQLRRIEKRNGAAYAKVFRDRWIPLEECYFAAYPIKEQCEFVFDNP